MASLNKGLLGLLYKGGRLEIGSRVGESLHKGALLILPSGKRSGETARLITKCRTREIPILEVNETPEELGSALGKPAVSLVLITDKKAAKALTKGD